MHLMPESLAFQTRLGALPITTYEAGETVLSAGTRTGQVQSGEPRNEIGQTIKKMEALLTPATASLVYAGYPYDPYA